MTFPARAILLLLLFLSGTAPAGAWRARGEGLLFAQDAGTDSGVRQVGKNAKTQPAECIRLLASPHFLTEKGLVPVGSFVLTRLP